jgi:hypothetical protein
LLTRRKHFCKWPMLADNSGTKASSSPGGTNTRLRDTRALLAHEHAALFYFLFLVPRLQ